MSRIETAALSLTFVLFLRCGMSLTVCQGRNVVVKALAHISISVDRPVPDEKESGNIHTGRCPHDTDKQPICCRPLLLSSPTRQNIYSYIKTYNPIVPCTNTDFGSLSKCRRRSDFNSILIGFSKWTSEWLKTGSLKISASRTEIRTTDLAAMEITVDRQDDNHELQRPTDWSVQMDESTDVSDLSILLVIARYLNVNDLEENFLLCYPLTKRCTGEDIFNAIQGYFCENEMD
ncbi:hypothetical protein AVEN_61936-1 [Araneus ventricosus]|uniref:CLIP domain-containing serine protease n=1 Tax=Araneus ventricosus TaxID=182803 RepID=A0A4Y2SW25_ARAVE|nr:hypothetical protein AVEN_61936-1 [Araneus ventricosus]